MKEELKKRIQALHSGLIPEGYANTPIGPLPKDWRYARLGDISEPLTETAGKDTYETLSISAGIGFVNQAEKFGKELSGKQYEKYIVLHKGDFSYNKGNSNRYPQGCIYRLNDREAAAVPNVFESFRVVGGCPDYYEQLFISGFLNRQLFRLINHGVRDDGLLNLTGKDFYSCLLPVPPVDEQHKIVAILKDCDNMIELYKAKAMQYQGIKKACLDLLFPQSGSAFPKLRFPDYTAAWEQRKLSDVTESIKNGYAYKADGNRDHRYKITRIESISSGVINPEKLGSSDEVNDNYRLKDGDILFSHINSLPYIANTALYTADLGEIYHGMNLLNIRSRQEEIDSHFLLHLLKKESTRDWFRIIAKPAVNQASISTTEVGSFEFLMPRMKEQKKISLVLDNLDTLITLHQRASNEYQSLKEALMQLLQTGVVRVEV